MANPIQIHLNLIWKEMVLKMIPKEKILKVIHFQILNQVCFFLVFEGGVEYSSLPLFPGHNTMVSTSLIALFHLAL